MSRIAILDYGMGNLRSVQKALERVGAEAELTADPDSAASADGVILPGVGAFPTAMRRVRELGHDRLVRDRVARGAPVLGICLGLQLLFESTTEHGGAEGIGVLAGEVTPLEAPGLKVPHIGWEPVRWERDCELTAGLGTSSTAPGPAFYFVHSLAARPAAPEQVLGSARWGERFTCAVADGSLYGVQFHPEKSSGAGLQLLRNFDAICSPVAAAA